MTFHLVHADDATLLSSSRAVIKRHEAVALTDAVDALRAARAIRDRADADAAALRQAARNEGLAEADAAVRDLVATGIGELVAKIDDHLATRRNEIADAAYAAVRAIIGEFDHTALVERAIDRTLARLDGDRPLTIEVAAELRDAVAAHLADQRHVKVVATPGFGTTDCRIVSENGSAIASLTVQLKSLADRWGVAA